MKESELAEKFIEYFNDGYEIYKEVPAYGIIDFVAKHDHITIAVEVKVSLNFDVIEQAFRNKSYCTFSYIAVPKPKKHHFGYEICKTYGIGVLTYNEKQLYRDTGIFEEVKPEMNRKNKWSKVQLCDYMKKSVAGSQNDRVTAFKNTIEEMAKYIKRHPGCSLKQCIDNVQHHYGSSSTARASIYQWLNKGIIKEFGLNDGKLILLTNG